MEFKGVDFNYSTVISYNGGNDFEKIQAPKLDNEEKEYECKDCYLNLSLIEVENQFTEFSNFNNSHTSPNMMIA